MKTLAPVEPKQRIEILDVLRGFALLGIIFHNMLYFSGYVFIPFDNLKQLANFQLSENIYYLLDIIITAKFYTLFTILFAVGFYIQFIKHTEDLTDFLKTYRRRLFILLVVGLIHSLIWDGDILLSYAMMGFIFILFRNVNSNNLIRWSVGLILFPLFIDLVLLPFFPAADNLITKNTLPIARASLPDMTPEFVVDTFQNGSIGEVFIINARILVWKYLGYIPSGGYFKFLGIFILGLYLASIGFFTEKSNSTLFLIASLILGLLATFSAKTLGGSSYLFPPTLLNILYKLLLAAGQIFLCFFYINVIFKIARTQIGRKIFKYLIPVGRMALSNYLFQTIIMITIFYNFGFNLFGRVGLVPTTCIAILILILEIIFSNIWLRHFKFGPFEWLWRSLTYKKRISIRHDYVS